MRSSDSGSHQVPGLIDGFRHFGLFGFPDRARRILELLPQVLDVLSDEVLEILRVLGRAT
jgi:hypothetical protein